MIAVSPPGERRSVNHVAAVRVTKCERGHSEGITGCHAQQDAQSPGRQSGRPPPRPARHALMDSLLQPPASFFRGFLEFQAGGQRSDPSEIPVALQCQNFFSGKSNVRRLALGSSRNSLEEGLVPQQVLETYVLRHGREVQTAFEPRVAQDGADLRAEGERPIPQCVVQRVQPEAVVGDDQAPTAAIPDREHECPV